MLVVFTRVHSSRAKVAVAVLMATMILQSQTRLSRLWTPHHNNTGTEESAERYSIEGDGLSAISAWIVLNMPVMVGRHVE